MRFATLALLWSCFAPHTLLAKNKPELVRVFIDVSPSIEGLSVQLLPDFKEPSESDRLHFLLVVTNLFQEEVFLVVTYLNSSFSFEERTPTVNRGVRSSVSGPIVPDNTQLLKRLHGALGVQDDTIIACGCCTARIPLTLSMAEGGSFSDWFGVRGVIRLELAGFFRASGKEFSTTVDIPFLVVEHLSAE